MKVSFAAGVNHVVEVGDLAIRIGDQGKVQRGALRLRDVLRPPLVGVERVDAQADHFRVPLLEFTLQRGHPAELGRAHRGVVLGMGEQHPPRISEPIVEPDRAFRRLGH